MNTLFRKTLVALTAITGIVALSSCNHKDLCYECVRIAKLRVAYDWRDAPDANPAGMCVYFYPEDKRDDYYRFDFNNTVGGEIELPAGKYKLITYNNDTELVRFSGANIYEAHEAYTRTGDLLEPLYGNGTTSSLQTDNGERVMITPDDFWGFHVTDVDVREQGEYYTFHKYDDTRAEATDQSSDTTANTAYQTITLYPHDMLCHYSYEVRHVENGEHLSRISASLSGMSGDMTLADEKLDAEPVTLPVEGRYDAESKEIVGKFLTFGHNAPAGTAHKMTFYVVMDDGKKYVIKDAPQFDVTDQVDDAPDPRHVHIIIDRLTLPTPDAIDDGWQPSVDDWGVVNEEIKV